MKDSVRDSSRMGPRGPIVEKRRLRLAPCDEALFIITTSPLDYSSPPPPVHSTIILPSGDSWVPTATLAKRRATRARSFAKAVRCYRLYGDITVNLRRTENCLSRERAPGNEVAKNRSVIANLTLSSTREPFRRARPRPFGSCMRTANGNPPVRAQPRFAAAAVSRGQRLKRGWRFVASTAAPAALYSTSGAECSVMDTIGVSVKRTNPTRPHALPGARPCAAIFFSRLSPRRPGSHVGTSCTI